MYDLKDFTVWCVRIPAGKTKWDESVKNIDSAPCKVCLDRLRKFGFGKIAFSDADGNIQIFKLDEFETDHMSFAQRKLTNLGIFKAGCKTRSFSRYKEGSGSYYKTIES